jgi:predicted GTPase
MKFPKPEQTLIAVKDFTQYAGMLQLDNLKQQISTLTKEIESGKYTIVIAGEVKKGKSSLINAILNMNKLLPEDSDVATSTAFQIIYGEEKKNTVYFRAESLNSEISLENLEDTFEKISNEELEKGKIIRDEELKVYGTEVGNPGNVRQVDYIKIELPNELLKSGLEIIDTPGLGGVLSYHAQITWKYIPTADAVIFVFDSIDSPITSDEAEWIKKIKNFTSLIAFAQTKIDTPTEEQWKAWQNRNLEELVKILETQSVESLRYFPISSKLRALSQDKQTTHFERSGFGPFEDFFFTQLPDQIIGKKCKDLLTLLRNGLGKKNQELTQEMKVLGERSVEKLEALKKQYADTINNIKDFENRVYLELRKEFSFEVEQIVEDGVQWINQYLHQTQINPEVRDFIETLKTENTDPDDINQNLDVLAKKFIDNITPKVLIFHKSTLGELKDLLEKYLDQIIDHLNESNTLDPEFKNTNFSEDDLFKSGANVDLEFVDQARAETIKFNRWDSTRNYVMGAGTGALVGAALGGVAAFFFPPVGAYILLTGAAGKVLGLVFSGISEREKKEKQVLTHLQAILLGLMAQLQRKVIHQYRADVREFNRQSTKEFERLIRETRSFNEKQATLIRRQIEQGGKADQEALKNAQQQLNIVKNLLIYIAKIV